MTDVAEGLLFIDGEFRESSNGARFDVFDPSDESLAGTASDATLDDVSAAVGAARRTFDETSWSTDHAFRKRCLRQFQEALRKEAEVFGPVLSMLKYEGGDDEAVRVANNTLYGLSGYVQTRCKPRRSRPRRLDVRSGARLCHSPPFYGG